MTPAASLRAKLKNVSLHNQEWKKTLSGAEIDLMNEYFGLNADLHLKCIGDSKNGPNLHTTYMALSESLRLEKKCHDDYYPSPSKIFLTVDILATILSAVGASIAVWSLFYIFVP